MIKSAKAQVAELETPCFIVNSKVFCDNVNELRRAMLEGFQSSILAYSVKTNALPYLLSLACACGLYAEVVSEDEYQLAKSVGFSKERIVYNGPLKSKETFLDALRNGAYVNIETKRELEWLQEKDIPMNCNLGIRINIDLNKLCPEESKNGEGSSRFGFDAENGELEYALNRIESAGLRVRGIHVHRTTPTRSLAIYKAISSYATEIIERFHLQVSYIDIGGGYYGKMPGKPGYTDYVRTIRENLNKNDVTIIMEPGNALLALPVDYVMSVIDQKKVGGKQILTCDGTRLDIDPFFHKEKYKYELLNVKHREQIETQILCGCTCLEKDILTEFNNEQELVIGDKVIMKWQGAYTMALTPNFIRFLPRVYALDGAQYELVRDNWGTCEWEQRTIMQPMPSADGYLFLNAGRRATLIKDFKKSLGVSAKIISADNWCVAPALFTADKYYLTPKISAPDYIEHILQICEQENIKAVTTCIDPEIEILAKNREVFLRRGILPLCPDERTAFLCFDKYEMFKYLREENINTVLTYDSLEHFEEGYKNGEISFPVFIKPRSGSGSVGAERIDTHESLKEVFHSPKYDYIIQEWMNCEDCDADVYIDAISNKAVAAILKKKIETRIGGASKTIAFKDDKLFDFIRQICEKFMFYGPVDMDFFYRNGTYYLSEINPRFGGAYLHGYGAGVDFPKMIQNNIHGIENNDEMGLYEEGSIMLMYDEVIMTNEKDLKGDYHD